MAGNDGAVLMGITLTFLLIGGTLPFINAAFGNTVTTYDTGSLEEDSSNIGVSATTVLFSTFTIFFWSFGQLPFWLDIIFLAFRFMFFYYVYKAIRGIGS